MNIFKSVPVFKPKRNVFDLSHEHKSTFNMGKLYPILSLDCLPGDSFRCNTEIYLRFLPMLAPIMHRVNVYTHFFFVPYRLLNPDWENIITGGENGDSKSSLAHFDLSTLMGDHLKILCVGGLLDRLGYKTDVAYSDEGTPIINSYDVNLLNLMAYHKIYLDYYIDQNLSDVSSYELDLEGLMAGGQLRDLIDTAPHLFQVQNRCWEKDYFTSALPWAQRGDQMVFPLAGSAPVEFSQLGTGVQGSRFVFPGGVNFPANANYDVTGKNPNSSPSAQAYPYAGNLPIDIDNSKNLSVDLSSASSITVNEFRRILAIQKWMETNARGGSRYIEQLLAHFGVRPQDSRLQRAEFIGGGKSPVQISEVLQQSASDIEGTTTPLGDPAGVGRSSSSGHSFTYHCPEHGVILGILSIMPRTGYSQGLSRDLTRFDRFDFAFPEFANLGEQEILNKELYAGRASEKNANAVFGYTPRYAEYKYKPDVISGDFRSSLNYWHLSRVLTGGTNYTIPLNEDFVKCYPSNRIFADTDDNVDHILGQIYFNIRAIRPLPKYGIPQI